MSAEPARLRLALCGDVMLGRGIDQILPHPGNPAIYVSQSGITDANVYIRAAEQRHGAIPAARGFDYVWGDALSVFARFAPDLRLINLETAITTQGKPWPNKWIHYRMNPRNVAALVHGGVDFCSLANNHLIDWGYVGLAETMNTLATVASRARARAAIERMRRHRRSCPYRERGGRLSSRSRCHPATCLRHGPQMPRSRVSISSRRTIVAWTR
jgi:poly-gamma-glutamate capsule biosynthesis protein CapA/YwtB (metallophosphatase superfamily)